ncbi:cytochrome P450 [Stereum hirsutum FP-91666 SS1]|uniref:cytochrome P450 n=1 Tax=Stereum hirsutum (strain FP-91666) TaxID=721885 RepID=UPI000444A5C4|nr:cytochrome P450 [Stereum hirsutum FP-91666 SS1]EIM84654.1 cytochrome P450 [Stereum hirsutum FP-91666 SS1]
MYSLTIPALGVLAIIVLYVWPGVASTGSKARRKLPPGPPRLPFVGSLFHLPKGHDWLVYEQWGKKYGGDLVHIDVLGSNIFVVNSAKAANELFEKRSSKYSDRPSLTALTQLLGFDWTLVFCPYGDRFRAFRKGFHTYLSPDAVKDYRHIERKSIHRLLCNLAEKPEEFTGHLRHMAGAIILAIAFGIDVKAENDPHVETAEKGLQTVTAGSTTRAAMYDFFPILMRIPSWIPGAGFKKEANSLRRFPRAMLEDPMQATREAMAEGRATSSVASAMLAKLESQSTLKSEIDVETVCALQIFFLAMTTHPEIQRQAQSEIDAIIGQDRLPDWDDETSLPYVGALVKEVLRWRIVTPLGVYHRLIEDDVYGEYFLPAGSTVVGNIWAITHDEAVYPDPMSFKPERFLESTVDFPEMVFGFGRRICPGRHLALESLWLGVASILATYDISKAVDENGREIEPVDDCVSGIVAYPLPFKCSIQPRSAVTERLAVAPLVWNN